MSTDLMLLALIPGIIIIIFVYRKDKVEKEPKSLIFKLILFGAISCIPAVILETVVGWFTSGTTGITYALCEAFLGAALCEELCKFILLKLGSWKHRAFDYRFDGIVYGVSVAVGFALLENILYVYEGGLQTAIMRGLLSVPLHAFCGVYMGVFYGAMKKYDILGERSKVRRYRFLALFLPMMIHGFYDTLAFVGNTLSTIIMLVFVAVMYILAIKVINLFARDDWKAGFYPHLHPLYSEEVKEEDPYSGYRYK